MAFVEVRTNLPTHRKTKAAARALGVSRHELMGHLLCLWIWGLDNVPSDGDLGSLTDVDLEEAAEWPEQRAGTLVDALVSAGFIDVEHGSRFIHDWDEYAGRLLRKREADRDRKARDRAEKRAAKRPQEVRVTARKRPSDTSNTARRRGVVEKTSAARPEDTAPSPADNERNPSGQPPKSRASRAPAGGRTVPHRTVPREVEKKEVLTARESSTTAARAGTSQFSISQDDERYPVARLLASRFKYRDVSAPQWERLAEIVDNEYPLGTTKGRDRHTAWRWLADLMRQLPRDAGDPIEAAFDEVNRRIGARLAAAAERDEAWDDLKHEDPGMIARQVVSNGIGPRPERGATIDHGKAVAMLRRVRGTVNPDAWAELLERYDVDEDELDEELAEVAQ